MHTDFCNQFWLVILIPNEEAHEVLSLLFQWDGVPPEIICDSAKEMIIGSFNMKLKEASFNLKQIEPFSPWSNAATREMTNLKKGSGRKLIKACSLKRLWDHCLELESYVRPNTAHSMYKLDREVPEVIMSSKISYISQFYEFEWFKGVML